MHKSFFIKFYPGHLVALIYVPVQIELTLKKEEIELKTTNCKNDQQYYFITCDVYLA